MFDFGCGCLKLCMDRSFHMNMTDCGMIHGIISLGGWIVVLRVKHGDLFDELASCLKGNKHDGTCMFVQL